MTKALTILIASISTSVLAQQPATLRVRHVEGVVHGFLALRTQDGQRLADGDLIQHAVAGGVKSRLTFRFRDGSLQDETVVFSQRGVFRLTTYHLVQKGRSFAHPLEMTIDRASSRVVVHDADDDGEARVVDERMELPENLANGLVPTLLKNVVPGASPLTLSMVVAAPKPTLVKLKVSSGGTDRFVTGATARQVAHYVVKVEIGGLRGLIAPLLNKEPPDSHVWILGGEAPAFIRSDAPMFAGGPIWRIELDAPTSHRTIEPSNHRTMEPSNHRAIEPSSHR